MSAVVACFVKEPRVAHQTALPDRRSHSTTACPRNLARPGQRLGVGPSWMAKETPGDVEIRPTLDAWLIALLTALLSFLIRPEP